MILTNAQMLVVQGVMDKLADRTGLIAENYRWPNKTVAIQLAEGHFDADQEAHVYKALRTIESVSCLIFVNRTNEETFVEVTVSSHCERIELLCNDDFFQLHTLRPTEAAAPRTLDT